MERNVVIYSGSGTLAATIEVPNCVNLYEEKVPIVILCHGHSRNKNDGLDLLSHRLVENGFAAIRFNFTGCGSESNNRYKLYCFPNWIKELMDVISFVSGQPFVDKQKIAVAGISMGATIAVYTAGLDKRISAVISMAGISDCEKWLEYVWENSKGDFSAFRMSCENAREMAAKTGCCEIIPSLNMYNDSKKAVEDLIVQSTIYEQDNNSYVSLDSIASLMEFKPIRNCSYIECPVFYIHGQDDNLVPQKCSEEMYECTKAVKKIKIYEGIDHNIPIHPCREIVFKDISEWLLDIFNK